MEGLVIAVSVLLALAADAWWDGRRDEVLEEDALLRLSAEFTGVDSVMRAWQTDHRSALAAGQQLMALTGPEGASTIGPDSVGALLGSFLFLSTV